MSLLKWDGKTSTRRFSTFDKKPLNDGALKEAVLRMAKGEAPVAAIIKSVTGGFMNHENISATQGGIVGLAPIVNMFWPGHGEQIMVVFGALFALLAAIKPFLPQKPNLAVEAHLEATDARVERNAARSASDGS